MPFVNTLPAIAIMLLCFGMAERDGVVIALGYFMTLVSAVYVGGLIILVFYAGMRHEAALEVVARHDELAADGLEHPQAPVRLGGAGHHAPA